MSEINDIEEFLNGVSPINKKKTNINRKIPD